MYILSFSLIGGFLLSACSGEESLDEKWHTIADEEGVLLKSNEGQYIMFSEEGMKADYTQISEEDPHIFPFDKGTTYVSYMVTQQGDNIVIKADNNEDLQYKLKIKGERMYEDEENDVTYNTDSYLLDVE